MKDQVAKRGTGGLRRAVAPARRGASPKSAAEVPHGERGRIPFCVRFGVTGHRELEGVDDITKAVISEVKRVWQGLPSHESTPVELAIVSQLAEGADRVGVDAVFRAASELGTVAKLEVVLPMHRDIYVELQQFSGASCERFEELLRRADTVLEPRRASGLTPEDRAAAYAAAGRKLVDRCDVLIAMWNGKRSGGRGGTADTLVMAAEEGKPCIWVPVQPGQLVQDNLGRTNSAAAFYAKVAELSVGESNPARVAGLLSVHAMKSAATALERLEEFNGEALPKAFSVRLQGEFGFPGGEDDWVAPYFLRATLLARVFHRRFVWAARAVCLLAVCAAACLAGHMAFGASLAWDWAEVACLGAVAAVFWFMQHNALHRRWITYRLLAERLRSARFLAPVGVDFRRATSFNAVYVEDHLSDWLLRAFEQLWQREHGRRRAHRFDAHRETLEALKRSIGEKWLGGQIAFHSVRSKHHKRWHRVVLSIALGAFSATIVCAILDALAVARQAMVFLSVALPAIGASLGALLTVNQHRALGERYGRMSLSLVQLQQVVRRATSKEGLASAGTEAARVMAEETDDWLGVLWFLDLEHP